MHSNQNKSRKMAFEKVNFADLQWVDTNKYSIEITPYPEKLVRIDSVIQEAYNHMAEIKSQGEKFEGVVHSIRFSCGLDETRSFVREKETELRTELESKDVREQCVTSIMDNIYKSLSPEGENEKIMRQFIAQQYKNMKEGKLDEGACMFIDQLAKDSGVYDQMGLSSEFRKAVLDSAQVKDMAVPELSALSTNKEDSTESPKLSLTDRFKSGVTNLVTKFKSKDNASVVESNNLAQDSVHEVQQDFEEMEDAISVKNVEQDLPAQDVEKELVQENADLEHELELSLQPRMPYHV